MTEVRTRITVRAGQGAPLAGPTGGSVTGPSGALYGRAPSPNGDGPLNSTVPRSSTMAHTATSHGGAYPGAMAAAALHSQSFAVHRSADYAAAASSASSPPPAPASPAVTASAPAPHSPAPAPAPPPAANGGASHAPLPAPAW